MEELSSKILGELLKLTPEQRVEVFTDIQYNKIFCVYCGHGFYEDPKFRLPVSK